MKISCWLTSLFVLILSSSTQAQPTVQYDLSFPNRAHHEAEITATFAQLPGQPLRVRMSRSSPGRYATHEFAKNIYNLRATDVQGKSLPIVRLDSDTWEISTPGQTVKVTYTLFGHWVDGTYTDIDLIHAHLNMPATFLWAKGLESQPITVTFHLPAEAGWKVATQLKPTSQPETFTAPNLQYLMDSPTELSNFSLREWTVLNTNQKPALIRLALHHDGTEKDVDTYVEMVKKIVLEEKGIYGELPDYDFGTYTFIQDVLPGIDGDGMEHRNSTFITDNGSITGNKQDLLGTVSHEFFHSWNVERIRPKTLEPFDFERANMSGELWFAEGFTQYYGDLVLARAGFYDAETFVQTIGRHLNALLNAPGTHRFSPIEMSQQAPFVDAATAVDPTNFGNVFTSYYTYGGAVALALDLSLRSQFKNLALDDYMRAVWQAHGKPEKPYTVDDLQQILTQVTKDSAFANTFFRQHIRGHQVADYVALFAKAGFLLHKAHPGVSFLGNQIGIENGKVIVIAGTISGTPLYQAGLDKGDVILTIDNLPMEDADDFRAALRKYKPGDKATIQFAHRGMTQSAAITFAEDPQLEVVPYEKASMKLSKEAKALRDGWLGSKAGK